MCCIAKRRGSTIEEKTHAVKLMKDGNLKQSEIECRTGVAPSTMRLAETHLRINGYSISTHESRLIMSTFCLCLRSVLRSVGRPHSFALMMNWHWHPGRGGAPVAISLVLPPWSAKQQRDWLNTGGLHLRIANLVGNGGIYFENGII